MNFCGDCGNKLNSDDKFCAKCGVGLQKEILMQKSTLDTNGSSDKSVSDEQLSHENIANELIEKASIDDFVEYEIDPWNFDYDSFFRKYRLSKEKLESYFKSKAANQKEGESIHLFRHYQFSCFGEKHFIEKENIIGLGFEINLRIERVLNHINNNHPLVILRAETLHIDSKLQTFTKKFMLLKKDIDEGKMNQFKEEFIILKSFLSYMYFMIGYSLRDMLNRDEPEPLLDYNDFSHYIDFLDKLKKDQKANKSFTIAAFYFAAVNIYGDLNIIFKNFK